MLLKFREVNICKQIKLNFSNSLYFNLILIETFLTYFCTLGKTINNQ
jgi:hypothetical protein